MKQEQFWMWVKRLAPLFSIFRNILNISGAATRGEYAALLREISRFLS
jgi:hypothetical protein